jgi:hypothetical protein
VVPEIVGTFPDRSQRFDGALASGHPWLLSSWHPANIPIGL